MRRIAGRLRRGSLVLPVLGVIAKLPTERRNAALAYLVVAASFTSKCAPASAGGPSRRFWPSDCFLDLDAVHKGVLR